MVRYIHIFALMCLSFTVESTGQLKNGCEKKHCNNISSNGSGCYCIQNKFVCARRHTILLYVSKLNDDNLATRKIWFKTRENELENICFFKGVTHEPPKKINYTSDRKLKK